METKTSWTNWKVHGSNPTSACRFLLSRLGRSGNIPALVPPSYGTAAGHRKVPQIYHLKHSNKFRKVRQCSSAYLRIKRIRILLGVNLIPRYMSNGEILETVGDAFLTRAKSIRHHRNRGREFTDLKVRGSNPTSVFRLPLYRLRQPGRIPALVPPSCGIGARYRKGVTAERI
ncbi:hypothetical protein T265_00801 [Opisthorchis viverrini]|uniref:Uncharacterized protein n=1 Tax=Opisthorchis viverrini TaxID=6198 RepID=A0A075A1R2_OPIVI|nr:hypothetical protein T265_00801 [Opisthorchis viverrini]KER33301.1 hypothetical protein T265_00801 [Opisthorchis viverrini]